MCLWQGNQLPCLQVKTADLDPAGRYIFAQHPHGVLSLSTWASFCSNACNFPSCFPGIDLHVGEWMTGSIPASLPVLSLAVWCSYSQLEFLREIVAVTTIFCFAL